MQQAKAAAISRAQQAGIVRDDIPAHALRDLLSLLSLGATRIVPFTGTAVSADTRRATIVAAAAAASPAEGLPDAALARLRSPIGLDLGGRTAEETAVSIAAELVALRHGGTGLPLTSLTTPIHRELVTTRQ